MSVKHQRTCKKGHHYLKTSDCPVCPICEAQHKPETEFLTLFYAPARRALEAHGINTVEQLAGCSQKVVLSWHGVGKASLPTMQKALSEAGLTFSKHEP